MKRGFKRAAVMAVALSLCVTSPVLAYEEQTIGENSLADETIVTYETPASYTIVLPKRMDIDNNSSESNYSVTVKGYTMSGDYISVTPEDDNASRNGTNIVLSDMAGEKPNLDVDVEQLKTRFESDEISREDNGTLVGVTTTGTLRLAGTPAKSTAYRGTLRFNISCTSGVSTYTTKANFMNTLKFYGAGDSIMEGHGNNYNGVLNNIVNLYGGTILKDYSQSGAYITKLGDANISDIQTQVGRVLARAQFEPFDEKTVLIFDGGGNDVMNMGTTGGTFNDCDGDTDNDVLSAFANVYGSVKAIKDTQAPNAPIVFIIPAMENTLGTDGSAGFISGFKEVANNAGSDLIVIDCHEFITSTDFTNDGLHLNQSGYNKLTKEIVDALYEYYN